MFIKPLDEILKKRVVQPFVYDNRNERFIGKRTGKPIVLSNNDSSESSLKMITQTITISDDGSQIKNKTNGGGKRYSEVEKNRKQEQQQVKNEILSEISGISEKRKDSEKGERKESYGEKERTRKAASYKTQQIDFSNQKKNLRSNYQGVEQIKSQKIRRDGFIELESFDLDLSSIKKDHPNDISEFNDLGDFLGFGAKKTKPVFRTQQDNVPTKQKPEQTKSQKDLQIRLFLQQGRNIYKNQPQVIVISSNQQVNKHSQQQQPQQELSFKNIQPVRIKAQVINISSDSHSVPQNNNKKRGNHNKIKPVVEQKKSSQEIIFESEGKIDRRDSKRVKKQTVITISDSEIKINADVVEIKTRNGVSIMNNRSMQEQKQQEISQKKIEQQKSFSFANSKNGIIKQQESKSVDRICSLKRRRSEASIASQEERKQTIYDKRKRQKKQKQEKQRQLNKKTIEEQQKKKKNDQNHSGMSKNEEINNQKRKKQAQKKRLQDEKKRQQNRKKQQKKKEDRIKKKKQQQQKKRKQRQRIRAQQQQKQREQEERRIQQSLIFQQDRKQRRQSLNSVQKQVRQESVRKTNSQTKNETTKQTKATKQQKKKNPPKNKRNQISSVETNKSKNNKTKKPQTKKMNIKKTPTNKNSSSVSKTNSFMSSVSSSKYSSVDSFNSNSDQISDSSSLSDFSNNSLNTTTRGIGQRKAKNRVKRQKSQPPQTPKQQIKETDDLTSQVQSFIGYNPSVAFNLISKKTNQLVIFAQMNTEGLLLQSMNGNYKQIKIQTLATTRNDLIQAFDRLSQKVAKKGKFWTFRNSENFTLHSTKRSNTQTILRVTITF